MAVHLVTYDLNKEAKRPNIVEAIRKFDFVQLSESSYAIDSKQSSEQIFNALEEFIDENDNLYVIGLHSPWAGFGPEKVNDWLHDRLKPC